MVQMWIYKNFLKFLLQVGEFYGKQAISPQHSLKDI